MKRYRAINFFIDCIRNIPVPQEIKQHVASRYGDSNLTEKFERYMSFKPPSLRVITEYHDLLQEIEDCFVHGLYYPALTSACCLGERIFNILMLRLRDYYKTSEHYKHIYRKDSFDDWSKSVGILYDWKVIASDDVRVKYEELKDIRHEIIHFNKLEDIEAKAISALRIIYDITTYFSTISNSNDMSHGCKNQKNKNCPNQVSTKNWTTSIFISGRLVKYT